MFLLRSISGGRWRPTARNSITKRTTLRCCFALEPFALARRFEEYRLAQIFGQCDTQGTGYISKRDLIKAPVRAEHRAARVQVYPK